MGVVVVLVLVIVVVVAVVVVVVVAVAAFSATHIGVCAQWAHSSSGSKHLGSSSSISM